MTLPAGTSGAGASGGGVGAGGSGIGCARASPGTTPMSAAASAAQTNLMVRLCIIPVALFLAWNEEV
jgi:hypothetical protein